MDRRRALIAVLLATVVTALAAYAVWQPGGRQPASMEERVYGIASELRCPVCDGQTVAESNQEASLRMRRTIREMVAEGRDRDEIIAHFVDRWGRWIVARPPLVGAYALIWLLPFGVLVGGGWLLWRRLDVGGPPNGDHGGRPEPERSPGGEQAAGSDKTAAGAGGDADDDDWIERRLRRLL